MIGQMSELLRFASNTVFFQLVGFKCILRSAGLSDRCLSYYVLLLILCSFSDCPTQSQGLETEGVESEQP